MAHDPNRDQNQRTVHIDAAFCDFGLFDDYEPQAGPHDHHRKAPSTVTQTVPGDIIEQSSFPTRFERCFPYHIAVQGQLDSFRSIMGTTTDEEAVRVYLENVLNIHKNWTHCVEIAGTVPTPHRPLEVRVGMSEGIMGVARRSGVDRYSLDPYTQRWKATEFGALPFERFHFDLLEGLNNRVHAEVTLRHEFFHLMTPSVPEEVLIQEGMAVAGTQLFSETHDPMPWGEFGAGGYKILGGKGTGGFALGLGAKSLELGRKFHMIAGCMSGVLFYDILGDTHDERLAHYKLLASVCKSQTGFGHETMPSVQSWLDRADRVLPGFKERYLQHPIAGELHDGESFIWMPESATNEQKDPWGTLFALHTKKNDNLGYTHKNFPSSSKPDQQHFDFSPAQVQWKEIELRCRNEHGEFLSGITRDGYLHINPRFLQSFIQDAVEDGCVDVSDKLDKPFAIETRLLGEPDWHPLGTNFYVNGEDLAHIQRIDQDKERHARCCKASKL